MSDAEWLEQLAALAASQEPAKAPWAAVTDYSFDARKVFEEPHAQLIKDTFKPRYVIDAGCGPDGHLVRCLLKINVEALGFDPQISKAQAAVNRSLLRGSLLESRFGNDDDEAMADLVVCREVLEHLTIKQLRVALRNLCRMTSKWVYVTTRFHPDPQHLLDVATSDDLDPTHITMLNQSLLRALFVLEGFTRCPEQENAMDFKGYGRVLVYER